MLENIFVTGTSNKLVLKMGGLEKLSHSSYYHTVTMSKPKSSHVSNFSPFTAQLICTYARTNLSQINTVITCFRIPSIPSFNSEDKEKLIEKSFQTEWYFSVDLLRQVLSLFTHNSEETHTHNKYHTTHQQGRLYICIPHINKFHLNDAQQIYYNSFLSVVKTFIKAIETSHEIALIFIKSDYGDEKNATEILDLIENLQNKKVDKKIFYQEPFFARLKKRYLSR